MISRESVEGHYVPNGGFLDDVVTEDPALSSSIQASSSYEASSDASIDLQNEADNNAGGDTAELHAILEQRPSSTKEVEDNTAEEVTNKMANVQVSDNVAVDETIVEEQSSLSAEDVDVYLDKCLLQALHTTVKDKDLPLPGSTLWYLLSFILILNFFNSKSYCLRTQHTLCCMSCFI